MNLDPTDDQRLLKDMLDRFVAEQGGAETRRAAAGSELGWSRQRWMMLAELGLLALLADEPGGGLGGGGTELMLLGEACGRGLLEEPILENAVMIAPILAMANGQTATEAFGALSDGSQTFALICDSVTSRERRLQGSARMVPRGDCADAFLIFVEGEGLFLLPADAAGVTREGYPLHGGGRAGDVRIEGAAATLILPADAGRPVIEAAGQRRIVYLVAEAVGLGGYALDATVEHLKTRVQFGKPLAANQALQHRAAEMYVELEQLRSAAILAASVLDDEDAQARRRTLLAAAFVAAKAARFIAQQAVQLHGGIGVTEEHAVGHCFLRLTAIALLLGGPDDSAARLAALGGFVSAAPYWEGGAGD